MNKHEKIRRNVRSFFLASCILLLVIVLLSTGLYFYFAHVLTETAYNNVMNSMMQAKDSSQIMLDNVTNFTTEMLNDPSLSLVFRPKPSVYDLSLALNRLSSFSILIPYVESVYLFNREAETIYLSATRETEIFGNQVLPFEAFPDQDALKQFQKLSGGGPIVSLRTYQLEGSAQKHINYSVITSTWQKWLSFPRYAIMINISDSYLRSIMEPIRVQFPDSYMALYSEGNWNSISGNEDTELLRHFGDILVPEEIFNTESSNGYYVTEVDGKKYLLVYVTYQKQAWLNCFAVPYHSLVAPARRLFDYTLFFSLAALCISTLCAGILTNHYSRLIDKKEEQLILLSRHLSNSRLAVHQNLLYSVLQSPADDQIMEKLKAISPEARPITVSGWYNVSIIAVDDFSKQTAEHPEYSQIPYMSEIAANFKRAMPQSIHCSSLLMLSRYIVFISSSEEMEEEKKLAGYLHHGQLQTEATHVSVSVLMGANAHDLCDLHAIYEQINVLRRQLMYYGPGCFVRMTTVAQAEPEQVYVYPENSEKLLSGEILKGNAETAYEAYLDIINSARSCSFAAFESAVGHLNIMLATISRKIPANELNETAYRDPAIDQFESVDALNNAFRLRIEQLANSVAQHKSSSKDRLVNLINQYVEEHYSDSSLGIEAIADVLGMSANYIGRTYKQATTITILEKLLEVRMKHARELLADSNMSVSDIASSVGFSSDSYFYKMFKLECMMTPTEYRRQIQQNDE